MSFSQYLSDGFDQCLPELVLNCVFLPMSYYENPADVFLD